MLLIQIRQENLNGYHYYYYYLLLFMSRQTLAIIKVVIEKVFTGVY